MNLFELNHNFREAIKRVEFFAMENDGEINESLEAEFKALEIAREEKALNVAGYIKELDAEAEAIKNQEKKLAERRKALENRAERLTEYLRNNINEGEKLSSPWAQYHGENPNLWRSRMKVQLTKNTSKWYLKY